MSLIISGTAPRGEQRLWAVVQLLRPMNVVMFAAGVVVGGVMAAGAQALMEENGIRLLVASGSAMLVGAGGNAFNDVFDVAHDRINRPARPLPAGRLSMRAAQWMGGVCTVLGVGLGMSLSWLHGALALGAALLLWAYNARMKHRPLVGNVMVSLVVALTLIYGSAAVGGWQAAWVGAGFALLTTLVREVIKDVEDQVGDAEAGSRTLPVVVGAHRALYLAAVLLGLTLLLAPWPFLVLAYSGVFLLFMLAAGGVMLRVLALLVGPDAPPHAAAASRLMKGVMVLGLIGLALA